MENTKVAAEHDSARYMALVLEALSRMKPRDPHFLNSLQRLVKDVDKEMTTLIDECLHDVATGFNMAGWQGAALFPLDDGGKVSSSNSVGSLLKGAVGQRAQKQMMQLLSALFMQSERVLQNHSYVIRVLHFLKIKQESSEPLHTLATGEESIWNKLEQVLIAFFTEYWATTDSKHDAIDDNVASTEDYPFTFVFEDVTGQGHATSKAGDGDSVGLTAKFMAVPELEPSPSHMAWSYTHIQGFIKNVDKLVKGVHCTSELISESPDTVTMETSALGQFIDNQVLDVYFPYIDDQVQTYFQDVMSNPEAFKPVTKTHKYAKQAKQSYQTGLLTGGVRTMEIVEYLFNSMIHMPKHDFVDKFIKIISEIVGAYVAKCDARFKDAVDGTAVAHRLAPDLVKGNTKESEGQRMYTDFLVNNDPMLAATRRERGDTDLEEVQDSTETITNFSMEEQDFDTVLLGLLSADAKDKRSLEMMDESGPVLLATISNTLDWFAGKLITLVSMPVEEFPVSMAEVWSDKVKVAYPDIMSTAKQCKVLSDNCMLFLRVELRHHCYNDLKVVEANWNFEHQDTETDATIVKLSRNLSTIEYRLGPHLSPAKCSLLFPQLGWVVANILIESLSLITEMNDNGALKRESSIYQFVRNLGNFASIGPETMEFIYSRVNQYYGIFIEQDPHGIMLAQINASGTPEYLDYTLEQYEILYNKTIQKAESITLGEIHAACETRDQGPVGEQRSIRKKEVATNLPHGYF